MDEQTRQQLEPTKVEVIGAPGTRVPISGDIFAFTVFCFLFGLNCLGLLGEGAKFTMGLIQLCLAGIFMLGAFQRIKANAFGGNTYLVFSFVFGLVGGATNTLGGLGVPINTAAVGVVYATAATLLLLTLPVCVGNPWPGFVVDLLATVITYLFAMGDFGVRPDLVYPISGVLLIVVGVLAVYMCVSAWYAYLGIALPSGRPLTELLGARNEAEPSQATRKANA